MSRYIDHTHHSLLILLTISFLYNIIIMTLLQHSVAKWLDTLGMGEYTELFRVEGYKTGEDVENLKDLDKKQLSRMGITKMGII